MTWLIDRLALVASVIAAVILAAMTVAVIYDVAMRNLFNAPTVWVVEYTSYAMAWLCFLGASETLRRGEHVGLRVLTDRLPVAARGLVCRMADLIVAVTAGALAYAGARWTIDAYRIGEVSDTVLQTPQVVIRVAFPVGMVLIALVAASRAVFGNAATARR